MQNLVLKTPFLENLGAKLKFLVPVISSVGNWQLSVPPQIFNPQVSATSQLPGQKTTHKKLPVSLDPIYQAS